MIVTVYLTKI